MVYIYTSIHVILHRMLPEVIGGLYVGGYDGKFSEINVKVL